MQSALHKETLHVLVDLKSFASYFSCLFISTDGERDDSFVHYLLKVFNLIVSQTNAN